MKAFKLVTGFWLLVILVLVLSCKDEAPEPLTAKNKLDATVTFLPSGVVKQFSADKSPEAIYMGYINAYSCVSRPGTYDFSCDYYSNKPSNAPIYMSWDSQQRGSITYTQINSIYAEGYFEAVCTFRTMNSVDSVLVKGTFSGYLK